MMSLRPILSSSKPQPCLIWSTISRRPSACQRSRAFHATAPRNDAYEWLLYVPHELLQGLHGAGVPWGWTLPAGALILRGAIVAFGGITNEKRQQRYMALNPLREAMARAFGKRFRQNKLGSMGRGEAMKALGRDVRSLHKRWDCGLSWRNAWRLWYLPVFLSMAETLRRMMGMRGGLLAWIVNPSAQQQLPVEETGETQMANQGMMEIDHSQNPWYAPTFADEGILWFSDLIAPDPLYILPVVVSGTMIFNVWWGSRAQKGLTSSSATKGLRRGLYLASVLSLAVTPFMPSGILCYWASSSIFAALFNFLLQWKYPIPQPYKACKRPLVLLPMPKRIYR